MWLPRESPVTWVGIKELRDGLSRHLAAVRAGQTVTITDHGRPVARIVPVDQPTALERLIAEGRVQPARQRERSLPEPVPAKGTVSDLVAEQRR
jgi:prevent-host-death family protein